MIQNLFALNLKSLNSLMESGDFVLINQQKKDQQAQNANRQHRSCLSVCLSVEHSVGGLWSGPERVLCPAAGSPSAESRQSVLGPGLSVAGYSSAGCRPADPAGHHNQTGD